MSFLTPESSLSFLQNLIVQQRYAAFSHERMWSNLTFDSVVAAFASQFPEHNVRCSVCCLQVAAD